MEKHLAIGVELKVIGEYPTLLTYDLKPVLSALSKVEGARRRVGSENDCVCYAANSRIHIYSRISKRHIWYV